MASKEVKTLLKKARDSIRNKEYKDALKHCKAALKLEKNNYNALVFVGVCATELGQLEQAQAAYKKASDEDPSQVLAWQGLASLYEKNQEFRQDLAGVYVQLLQLYERGDKLKWKEISLKLCDLYNQQGHFLKGADILEELIKSSEDEAEQYTWWSQIAEMLTEELQATDLTEIKLKLDRAYQHLTQEEWPYRTQEDLAKHYISYIQFLLKIQIDSNSEVCEETRQRVLYQCQAMAKACPGSAFPLETLGKLWLEDDDAGDAPSVFERLCELEPSSGVGLIGMGCQQMKNKDLSGALQNLEKGLQSSPQCTAGWLYLAQTRLGCHDYSHAEKSSKKGLSCLDSTPGMIRRSQFSFKLSLVMAEALYKQGLGKAAEAKLVYEQLLKESKSLEVYTGLGEALLVLGETNAANEACSKALEINTKYHPALALQGKISHHEGFNDDAELRFLEAIELCEDCALYHFLLGKLYWEMNGNLRADKSKCLAQFLMAARLDPHSSATFLHLGHYYRLAGNDLRRACRCYQKSFDLNPKDDNAGSHLCDLLSQLGEEDAVMSLLSRVTKAAPPGEGKWAWLRLGLYYLRHNDSNNSVTCFQNTLRADLKDRHCWECLGEAYLSRGSYTAALKAFTRATELDPTSTYSLYQTAAIKQLLCIFSEAVQEYREILGPKPDYVPALKGLGEACLCLARSALAEDFNSRAVDHVGEGLHALAKAVEIRPGMSCLWKLIGDCCTVLHPVASSSVSLPLPEVLQKCLGNDSVAVAGKKELLSIGTSAYGRALKCLPDCASLWNDLGFSYFLQAKVADEGRDRLAQRAVQVLKKGVSLEPTNHKLWNTLGVVCGSSLVDNPDLSQHAFIMSIKTEPNNVSAWTNLGVLYLKHGKVEPAHDAFKYAQALDPSYTAAWVGQATIAEIIGSDEAADLFRHTTELSSHTESSVGYCHWICTDLLSGDRIKTNKPTPSLSHLPTGYRRAVLNASVAMTKYTDRIRGIAGAYNMHGLLLEHQCLYRQAQRAFHSAVKLLEGDGAEQDLLNTVHINHARALSALGRHDEAVAEYLQVKPLTGFYDVCGLALAYYLSGNIAESYRSEYIDSILRCWLFYTQEALPVVLF
ncbi:tetratricopeptide repeat protein 37 [Nematostella vectensis]|uniref:tetratricopeptide repeat protein 37 n=1 Tax=Nematostella vectensis TaxID=45351 RepID=UPI0020772435|nr:tetratricopeptide repeat protein 37 [Nematostella vectensis]